MLLSLEAWSSDAPPLALQYLLEGSNVIGVPFLMISACFAAVGFTHINA
jgi:hypothetical protein